MSELTTMHVVVSLVNCALNVNPTAPQKRIDSDSLRIGTFTVILIAKRHSLIAVISYQLSVISYQLSVISYQLSVFECLSV